LLLAQDFSGCLSWRLGEAGLTESELAEQLEKAKSALDLLRRRYAEGSLPHLAVPERREDLPLLQRAALRHRRVDTTIVLGTGGSSLGGQAFCALAAGGPGRPAADGPQVVFCESIDPLTFEPWLAYAEGRDASFLAISKSGATAETMAQILAAWRRLVDMHGAEKAAQYVTVLAEPGDSPLLRFARRHGIATVDHDPGIGGRYSVLTATGCLPGLIAGLDAQQLRAGAAEALRAALDAPTVVDSPPALGAALQLALAKRGKTISVMLPYADQLRPFALWYCQLWAESLGKGGHGTTPVAALGPADQHSQLQLWLDGPRDKAFTVVQLPRAGTGPAAEGAELDKALAYLAGRTMGDLLEAEQRATVETLAQRRCPVRVIRLARLDERALGALFMHFMLETMIAGAMLGVDPFDQPAVEAGKNLARKHLSEMGRAT
jgi:glucose-6-phosphate isomerase